MLSPLSPHPKLLSALTVIEDRHNVAAKQVVDRAHSKPAPNDGSEQQADDDES